MSSSDRKNYLADTAVCSENVPELPRSSPDFEDLDAPESEGDVLNGTEGDLKDEKLVGYAVDLASLGYGVPPTIRE